MSVKSVLENMTEKDWEIIGLKATVAQQAKMIEHLRGGPTPLYTAVDMANAARDGFRGGVAKLNAAYRAGWDASGEGWNAEYPCDAHEKASWAKDRDTAIAVIIEADVSKAG